MLRYRSGKYFSGCHYPDGTCHSGTSEKGGIFITSGIIDFKEQEVKEALEKAGFEILETNYQGEWVNITAKKC